MRQRARVFFTIATLLPGLALAGAQRGHGDSASGLSAQLDMSSDGTGEAGAGAGAEREARLRQVRDILRRTPLVDGHNDLPWQLRERFHNQFESLDLTNTRSLDPPLHTDMERLHAGMVGGQFWSVYVPVDLKGAAAVQAVLEQIDVVHRLVRRYPRDLELAYTAADIERIHAHRRVASLVGVEGGHCIGNSLAVLRQLYVCGARYMTLSHWKNTDWVDAATDQPRHDGLSPFGREVVREMNRLGMLVDLSHVSPATMHDVLDIAAAPVVFSHSSARAVVDFARNVPDDVLRRLPANGGVVMVNFAPGFVSNEFLQHGAAREAEQKRLEYLLPGDSLAVEGQLKEWDEKHPKPRVTLAQLADHIDHIRKVAGIDHVGLGSDFDGIRSTPVGLEDVSCFPALLAELLQRGYTADDVRKVAGLNLLRAMRAAEKVAAKLQDRPSSEVRIEDADAPANTAVRR